MRGGTAASPCGQGAFLKKDQSQVLALLWGDLPDFQSSLAFPFSFIRAVNEKSLPYRNLLHRYDNSDKVRNGWVFYPEQALLLSFPVCAM